ncbi:MAG TPA: metallophosphoesterase [Kofleriaceae bacterium]|nr:metallophosphoesterase [Kofleriaceae bacterium]
MSLRMALVMPLIVAISACGSDGDSSPERKDAPVTQRDAPPADAPAAGDASGVDSGAAADAPPAAAVIVATGDIAGDWPEDSATSALVDTIDPDAVLLLGDIAYFSGSESQYEDFFDPAWGAHKSLLHPSPGNHDHVSPFLGGYCDYFGDAAHCQDGYSYYSFDVGSWHIIALDSGCSSPSLCIDPTDDGSDMRTWLAADLAADQSKCTLAYFHHPRFSSGKHGNASRLKSLWQQLYDGGVDVVLNGHEHDYERFAPQDPDGNADDSGITEVVVGIGGIGLRDFDGDPKANSVVRSADAHGVLKMTLHPSSYEMAVVAIDGDTFTDESSGTCH